MTLYLNMASNKQSLKVLIISSEYPPEGVGGLGTHVFELTNGLSRANCDVTVFAPSNFATRIYRGPNLTVHMVASRASTNHSDVLQVALRGENKLVVACAGQPDYELLEGKNRIFYLKNTPGYSIEFKLDERGFVRAALLSQPNGISTLNYIQPGV